MRVRVCRARKCRQFIIFMLQIYTYIYMCACVCSARVSAGAPVCLHLVKNQGSRKMSHQKRTAVSAQLSRYTCGAVIGSGWSLAVCVGEFVTSYWVLCLVRSGFVRLEIDSTVNRRLGDGVGPSFGKISWAIGPTARAPHLTPSGSKSRGPLGSTTAAFGAGDRRACSQCASPDSGGRQQFNFNFLGGSGDGVG